MWLVQVAAVYRTLPPLTSEHRTKNTYSKMSQWEYLLSLSSFRSVCELLFWSASIRSGTSSWRRISTGVSWPVVRYVFSYMKHWVALNWTGISTWMRYLMKRCMTLIVLLRHWECSCGGTPPGAVSGLEFYRNMCVHCSAILNTSGEFALGL
jgi:hypothetical protein